MTTAERRLDRMEGRQDTMEDLIRLVVQDIEGNRQILEEMRRENRQTRRIWIAIAKKQELFDDEEFKDVFGEEE